MSWTWDLVADRLRWSRHLYRISRLEPARFEATLGDYLDHVHPEDREPVEIAIRASLETGEDFGIVSMPGTAQRIAADAVEGRPVPPGSAGS